MKCLIAFIFLASLLGACTSVSEKKGTSNKDLHNEIDSISIVDPNKKIIKWKLNGMAELLKDTLDFSLPNLNNCEYEWQNDSYISIRSSCGSPCWYSYLFPKRNGLKLKRYFYSIGSNPHKNIIVYQPDGLDSKYMLQIENFKNNKLQYIKRDICPSDLTSLCIESVRITDKEVKIYWQKDFFNNISFKLKDTVTIIKLNNRLVAM